MDITDFSFRRHLPADLSDTSAAPGWPEASFQIPTAAGSSTQLLLEDDCADFLQSMDDTLSTPAQPMRHRRDDPLTLAELTPRSRHSRVTTRRSPVKSRPPVPSHMKRATAHNLSAPIQDTLSPFKQPDISFQIPRIGNDISELLMADACNDFFSQDAECSFPDGTAAAQQSPDPLTLSQLTPESVAETSSTPILGKHCEPSLQQSDVGAVFSVLKAEIQSLDDSDLEPGQKVSEGLSTTASSPAIPADSTRPSTWEDPQMPSTDVDVQRSEIPEECSTEPVQSAAHQSVVPRASLNRSEPKATVKRGVIGGGIAKRSKANPPKTNAARGKTATQRKLSIQRTPAVNSATPVNTASAGNASCETADCLSGGLVDTAESYGQTQVRVTQSTFSIQSSVPGSDLPRVEEDAAQPDDIGQPPKSTLGDRDLDRTSNCQTEKLTQPNISPSESIIEPVKELEPAVVSNVSDKLSLSSGQLETVSDAPQETHSAVPPSPMKPASKRPASVAAGDAPVRFTKRGRIDPANFESSGVASVSRSRKAFGSSLITRSKAKIQQSLRARNASSSSRDRLTTSESRLTRSATAGKKRAVNKPISTSVNAASRPLHGTVDEASHPTTAIHHVTDSVQSSSCDDSGRASTSHTSPTSTPDDLAPRECHDRVSRSTSALTDRHGHMSRSVTTRAQARLAASLPPAKPTVPVGFRFHSDARIEARKKDFAGDSAARQLESSMLSIPDFKSLHEAEAHRLAARREQIVPILPGHVELSTESRAQERERYDEARRAREQEAERLLEEKRRLEAIEEEKEIKELRRKAVPKANEIPEWYAHAPKRSRDAK